MKIKTITFCTLLCGLMSFSPSQKEKIKYVALGDSYTICTGAAEQESWPLLMSRHLTKEGVETELVVNPARNGFTTQDLIDLELPIFDQADADFVTLLIGVNDWVRNTGVKTFEKNLSFILDHLQGSLAKKRNIILITIPDFGVTPQGKIYAHGRDISKGIGEFNAIIKAEAAKRKLSCVDLFETSKAMGNDKSLRADDDLHPSAKEYATWETMIFPVAKDILEK